LGAPELAVLADFPEAQPKLRSRPQFIKSLTVSILSHST